MGSVIGTIKVPVSADIAQAQSSLQNLRKFAENLDLGSGLGRSIDKALSGVEKALSKFEGKEFLRFGSESQLTKYQSDLQNIYNTLNDIAVMAQGITVSDLNTSKFTGELSTLQTKLESIIGEMNSLSSADFSKAVKGSSEMQAAFKAIGEDLTKLDISKVSKTLDAGIEKLTRNLEKAKKTVEDLRAEQERLNSTSLPSKVIDSSNRMTTMQTSANQYLKDIQIKPESFKQLQSSFQSLIQSDLFKDVDSTIKDKLRQVLENGLNGIDASNLNVEQMRGIFQSLKGKMQTILTESGHSNNPTGFFSSLKTNFEADAAVLRQTVTSKTTELKTVLTEQLTGLFPSETTGTIKSLVDEFIKAFTSSGSWDNAKQVITSKTKAVNEAVTKATTELAAAKVDNTKRLAEAEAEVTRLTSASNTAKQGRTTYDNFDRDFTSRLAKLESDLAAIKDQINEKGSAVADKLKAGIGSEIKPNQEAIKNLTAQVAQYGVELDRARAKEKFLGQVSGLIQRWVGVYAAVRYVTKAYQDMKKAVAEVDKTITNISIVTGMSQDKLWGQMDSYIAKAQKFAASISGVYEVSQLYYQQGLETAQVSALTDETLKLATVSGLGYSEATNYMTNAVRSFKMEMSDAAVVTDTYAALAASAATSVSEIAVAMSKTASSAQAVGMTLQDTASMITVMTEATREAPENIGSALKSIISRYGELKEDPTKLVDSEGQEMSFNKVDKALSSVGISMKDANGQFRSFTDVIVELSGKWDTLDTNTQRYIATVMAGNRQQSRFLALVSSGERLTELMSIAEDSEGAGTEQYMAYLDSIEAKQTKLSNSWKALYMTEGVQNTYKGILDIITQITNSLNTAEKYGGGILAVISRIGTTFYAISHLVTSGFTNMMAKVTANANEITKKRDEVQNKLDEEKKNPTPTDSGKGALTSSPTTSPSSTTPSTGAPSTAGTSDTVDKKVVLHTEEAKIEDAKTEAEMEGSTVDKKGTLDTSAVKTTDMETEATAEASTIDKKSTLDDSAAKAADAAAEATMESSTIDKKETVDVSAAEAVVAASDSKLQGQQITRTENINTATAEAQAAAADAKMATPLNKSVKATTSDAETAIEGFEAKESDPVEKTVNMNLDTVSSSLGEVQAGVDLLGEALANAGIEGGQMIAQALSEAIGQAQSAVEELKTSLSTISGNINVAPPSGTPALTTTPAAQSTISTTAATTATAEMPQIDTASLQQAQTLLQQIQAILQQITSDLGNFGSSLQSLPTTLENLKTSFSEVQKYLEEMPDLNVKLGNIDGIGEKFNSIAKSANDMVQAIQQAQGALNSISSAANSAGNGLSSLKTKNATLKAEIKQLKQEIAELQAKLKTTGTAGTAAGTGLRAVGSGATAAATGVKTLGQSFKEFTRNTSSVLSVIIMAVNALQSLVELGPALKIGLGAALVVVTLLMWKFNAACAANPFVAIAMAIITAITMIVQGINEAIHADEKKLEDLQTKADEARDKMTEQNSKSKSLNKQAKNLSKLAEAQYDSEEALKAFHEEQNKIFDELGDQIPELFASYDQWGNALINLEKYYEYVNEEAQKTATLTAEAADAQIDLVNEQIRQGKIEAAVGQEQIKTQRRLANSAGVRANIAQYSDVGSGQYNQLKSEFYTSHAEAQNIVTEFMVQAQARSGITDQTEWLNSSSYKTAMAQAEEKVIKFYEDIGDNVDALAELNSNRGKLTKEQYRQSLIDLGITDEDILNYYLDQFGNYTADFNAMMDSAISSAETNTAAVRLGAFVKEKASGFIDTLSNSEKLAVKNYYTKITKMVKSGTITEAQGQQMLDEWLSLWALTDNLSAEDREIAQAALADMDPTDASSVRRARKTLIESGIDWGDSVDEVTSSFDILEDLTPENLTASLNTFFSNVGEVFSKLEKTIKSLNEGVDWETAYQLVTNSNRRLHISDFEFRNGKLYYSDLAGVAAESLVTVEQSLSELSNIANSLGTIPTNRIMINTPNMTGITTNSPTAAFAEDISYGEARSWLNITEGSQLPETIDSNYFWNRFHASQDHKADILRLFTNIDARNNATLVNWIDDRYSVWMQLAEEVRAEYDNDFTQFLQSEAIKVGKDITLVKNYKDYLVSSNLIKNGDIASWLATNTIAPIANVTDELLTAIQTLDFNTVRSLVGDEQYRYIMSYADLLYETYHNAQKAVYTSAIDSLTSGRQAIQVTEINERFLRRYGVDVTGSRFNQNRNLLDSDISTAYLDLAALTDEEKNALENEILQDTTLDEATKRSLLSKLHTSRYTNTFYNALGNIITSFDNVTYDTLDKLAQTLNMTTKSLISWLGAEMDPLTGNYKIAGDKLRQLITEQLSGSLKQYNEIIGKIADAEYKTSQDKEIYDIITNYSKLSAEMVGKLATYLNKTYDEVMTFMTDNGNGTYSMSVPQLHQYLNDIYGDNPIPTAIKRQVSIAYDNVIKSISTTSSLQTKGYTSIADMEKIMDSINNLITDASKQVSSILELFTWDTTSNTYVLSAAGLRKQIQAIAAQFTQSIDEVALTVARNTLEANRVTLAKAINIKDYITNRDNKSWNTLERAIQNYNDYIDAILLARIDDNTMLFDESTLPNYGDGTSRQYKIQINNLRNTLEFGGLNAVKAIQDIAKIIGEENDYSTLKNAYLGKINEVVKTADALANIAVGSVLDKEVGILLDAEAGITFNDNLKTQGLYVVEAVTDIGAAYSKYLEKLKLTAGATLKQINAAAAKVMQYTYGNNNNQGNLQSLIDLASSATSLTYEAFGEFLTNFNIELDRDLMAALTSGENPLIKILGGDKIAITDFDYLAREVLHLDVDSPAYVSALKTYNDSLIAFNSQVETNILDEFSKLNGAIGGSQLNFTQLIASLQPILSQITEIELPDGIENEWQNIQAKLLNAGARFESGILTLADNADILSITSIIAYDMQEYGNLTQAQLAQLADTVNEVLKNYTDMIHNGISGTLSNVDMQKLVAWGASHNITVAYTRTAEGLKLTSESAWDLYAALKQVDSIAAKSVLKDLLENEKTAKSIETITGLMGKINNIRKQLEEAERQPDNDAVIASLRQELELYNDIARARMNDASSYSFMSNDLPTGLQGPINYWDSWYTGIQSMITASSNGYMTPQDFYNLVSEFGNMAIVAGEDLEIAGYTFDKNGTNASKLILDGFKAIKMIDGEGARIDLSSLGLTFADSAAEMDEGLETGIHKMAESQVKIWEGIVGVLEIAVQMEQLADLDLGDDNVLNLPDITIGQNEHAQENIDTLEEWRTSMNALLETSEEAAAVADSLKINSRTLRSTLNKSVTEWDATDVAIVAFWRRIQAHDYNIKELAAEDWAAIEEAAEASGEAITVEWQGIQYVIGNGTHFSVRWTRTSLNNLTDEAREEIQTHALNYLNNPTNAEVVDYLAYLEISGEADVLANNVVRIQIANQYYYFDADGHPISSPEGEEDSLPEGISIGNVDDAQAALYARNLMSTFGAEATDIKYESGQFYIEQSIGTGDHQIVYKVGYNADRQLVYQYAGEDTFNIKTVDGKTLTPSEVEDYLMQQAFQNWLGTPTGNGDETNRDITQGSTTLYAYNADFRAYLGMTGTLELDASNVTVAVNSRGEEAKLTYNSLIRDYLSGKITPAQFVSGMKDLLEPLGFQIPTIEGDTELVATATSILEAVGVETIVRNVDIIIDDQGRQYLDVLSADGQTTTRRMRVILTGEGANLLRTVFTGNTSEATLRTAYEADNDNTFWRDHFQEQREGQEEYYWKEGFWDSENNMPNWANIITEIQNHPEIDWSYVSGYYLSPEDGSIYNPNDPNASGVTVTVDDEGFQREVVNFGTHVSDFGTAAAAWARAATREEKERLAQRLLGGTEYRRMIMEREHVDPSLASDEAVEDIATYAATREMELINAGFGSAVYNGRIQDVYDQWQEYQNYAELYGVNREDFNFSTFEGYGEWISRINSEIDNDKKLLIESDRQAVDNGTMSIDQMHQLAETRRATARAVGISDFLGYQTGEALDAAIVAARTATDTLKNTYNYTDDELLSKTNEDRLALVQRLQAVGAFYTGTNAGQAKELLENYDRDYALLQSWGYTSMPAHMRSWFTGHYSELTGTNGKALYDAYNEILDPDNTKYQISGFAYDRLSGAQALQLKQWMDDYIAAGMSLPQVTTYNGFQAEHARQQTDINNRKTIKSLYKDTITDEMLDSYSSDTIAWIAEHSADEDSMSQWEAIRELQDTYGQNVDDVVTTLTNNPSWTATDLKTFAEQENNILEGETVGEAYEAYQALISDTRLPEYLSGNAENYSRSQLTQIIDWITSGKINQISSWYQNGISPQDIDDTIEYFKNEVIPGSAEYFLLSQLYPNGWTGADVTRTRNTTQESLSQYPGAWEYRQYILAEDRPEWEQGFSIPPSMSEETFMWWFGQGMDLSAASGRNAYKTWVDTFGEEFNAETDQRLFSIIAPKLWDSENKRFKGGFEEAKAIVDQLYIPGQDDYTELWDTVMSIYDIETPEGFEWNRARITNASKVVASLREAGKDDNYIRNFIQSGLNYDQAFLDLEPTLNFDGKHGWASVPTFNLNGNRYADLGTFLAEWDQWYAELGRIVEETPEISEIPKVFRDMNEALQSGDMATYAQLASGLAYDRTYGYLGGRDLFDSIEPSNPFYAAFIKDGYNWQFASQFMRLIGNLVPTAPTTWYERDASQAGYQRWEEGGYVDYWNEGYSHYDPLTAYYYWLLTPENQRKLFIEATEDWDFSGLDSQWQYDFNLPTPPNGQSGAPAGANKTPPQEPNTGNLIAAIEAVNNADGSTLIQDLGTLNNARAGITLEVDPQLKEGAGGTVGVKGTNTFHFGNSAAAKGNLALAGGTSTLMGELGPELVVSGGKYFVVGQNGAEFVNLDKDAIVFNHLQTKRLLNTGHGGHGKPITNEREATSFAKGNASGPAMASASAALNSARQILAAWKSLANLGLSDLAQKAGGGGGGGGGEKNNAAYLADLERWYNLLREVDRLEKSITYQETLRSKLEKDRVIDGKAYYESQKESIKLLEDEIAKKHELVILQKQYYDARRQDLEASPFGQFMHFDEHGHLQFTDDYAKLVDMNATNADNSTKYTAEEQYNMLKEWGFEDYLKYDTSGKEIDMSKEGEGYTNAVKAFWDKFEGWKEELDDLYDGFTEYQNDVLSLEGKYNELLQEIIDNQISLENRIEKAIEDARQREIDEAKSQKDAIQKSSQDFIQGLSDSLDKERKMYEDTQSQNELNRMRRQLAILQRSGGSASQIRSLQQDIASREQDEYFNEQQNQIDAIQKASEAEIERLDHQIQIMTDTLAYEKEHGLLWNEVKDIMTWTPEEIESFLLENSKDLEGKSTLQIAEDLRTIKSEIEQWIGYRDDENNPIASEGAHNWNSYYTAAQSAYSLDEKNDATIINAAKAAYNETYEHTGDENAAARAADEIFYKQFGDRPGAHAVAENIGHGTPSSSSSGGGGGNNKVTVKFAHLDKNTNKVIAPTTEKSLNKGEKYKNSIGKQIIANYTLNATNGNQEFTAAKDLVVRLLYDRNTSYKYKVEGTNPYGKHQTFGPTYDTAAAADAAILKAQRLGWTNLAKTAFKKGGLANYTGLAMVHGSPQNPEAFLNAEETHMWRDKILSGNSGSLTSMLIDFQDMVSGMVNSDSYSEIGVSGSGINIENAVVNMNATIANDYDARRAANTVMDEMIRIARKTTAQQARR